MPRTSREDYELGGLVDVDSARLGRRLDIDSLLRPDLVELDQGRRVLRFSMSVQAESCPEENLLDKFLRLVSASDRDIAQFAAEHGALSVEPFQYPQPDDFEEATDLWRHWSRRAEATLAIAAKLRQNQRASPDDWEVLRPWWLDLWSGFFARRQDWTEKKKQQAVELNRFEDVMNAWLREAAVRPCFSWFRVERGIGFTNVIGGHEGSITLLGALALQLVLAASQAKAIAVCAGCGRPYARRWYSPTGRRNYCKTCGRKAAMRDASARYRALVGTPILTPRARGLLRPSATLTRRRRQTAHGRR